MNIRCYILSVAFILGFAFLNNVLALEACAKTAQNGGLQSLVVSENFTSTGWDDNWRDIAEEAQDQAGNNAAYNTDAGIHITFSVRVFGMPSPMPPLVVSFNGETSLEKAILDQRGLDTEDDDPNPCDPIKNELNGQSTSGDGGGGGSGVGSGSWYINPGDDPCANGRCIVIITPA